MVTKVPLPIALNCLTGYWGQFVIPLNASQQKLGAPSGKTHSQATIIHKLIVVYITQRGQKTGEISSLDYIAKRRCNLGMKFNGL